MIGAEIKISEIEASMILFSIIMVVISSIVRTLTAYLCASSGGFNWKEKAFISIAWLAKAALQAALCGELLAAAE